MGTSSSKSSIQILRITAKTPKRLRKKIIRDLHVVVEAANSADQCDHGIRVHLESLIEDERVEEDGCFVALSRKHSAVGMLLALYDEDTANATALVHPQYRLRGVFRRLLSAFMSSLPNRELSVRFEICEQSFSGACCAKHLGWKLRDVDECDQYLECRVLTSSTRLLPSVKLISAGLPQVEEILSIWASEYGPYDQEQENEERQTMIKDLSTRERCWLLRSDDTGTAIGSITFVTSENDAYFMNVVVRPEFRGKGLGEAMIREATHICLQDFKKTFVALETTKPQASRLYQRAGFVVKQSYHEWEVVPATPTTSLELSS